MEGWSTRHEVRSRNWEQLREEKLEELLSLFDKRMGRLNDQYLRMMGEHIADIGKLWPSDVHRLQQIRRMNRNLKQIQHRIGVAAERSAEDIERVFEQIANYDIRMAEKILGKPDTHTVGSNAFLRRILQAQQRETVGRMRNLSNTTVVSKYYRDAVDEAVSAVQSGVEDYGAATRRVIREAGSNGLRIDESGSRQVDYLSGYHRRLDTAARMNVLDGVRHLNQTIMEEVGREFGANGVEIDAHMLCAEDHLPYQGGQYSNEDFEQIQDGLQRPFGEWNCRHSWHPIMLGISPPAYAPEQLEQFERYSTERVEIDGVTKTRYQWSQEMRRIETAVREQKDTATLARYAGNDKLRQRCQGTILQLNRKYEQLAGAAGLTPEYRRTYVQGFRDGKTEAIASDRNARARSVLDSEGNVLFEHGTTKAIQEAQSFTEIAEQFWYDDKYGHLRTVLNDNLAKASMDVLREIAEGVNWARKTYGLTNEMPRTIKFGKLDSKKLGEYNLITREITLQRGISVKDAYLTIVHEMTHFADDLKGHVSERLLREALSNLGVKYGSNEAVIMQFNATHSFEEKVYKDPMEVLAYSVEDTMTGRATRLEQEITELWWRLWQQNDYPKS